MRGRVDGAGRGEVHGAGGADEAREEVGGAGLHDDASAREDKADFGGCARDANTGGECHGDAHADRGAVDGGDGWLGAVVDREGDAAAAGESKCLCCQDGNFKWGAHPSLWSAARSDSFCATNPMSRSAPAQNILPPPVITTHLTRSSTSNMLKT